MTHGAFPEMSAPPLASSRTERGESEAWSRFVRAYGPRIMDWGRRWGLRDADARDVAQTVLIHFWRREARFRHDRSRRSRGWLRTLVQGALCEFVERGRDFHSGTSCQVESIAARDDLALELEQEYDRELLRLAMSRVRDCVEPKAWQAFWLLNFEGLSGEEAVGRVGLRLGSTFAASSKVRRLLREELCRLENDLA